MHEADTRVALDDFPAFQISPDRGFLPELDPARALPGSFAAWEELTSDLPKLLLAGRARAAVDSLPLLPTDALEGESQYRRAMLLLSYLGHAYVWGETPPSDHLAISIAIPWHAVAVRLGRPPVLSYASYALDNWRRYDAERPIALGNIAILQNFMGGADEDWFIAVHVDIEAKAAPLLSASGRALTAVIREDTRALGVHLGVVARSLEAMVGVLHRMPERCDPYIYYRRVRPYIHGWKDNPALPHGLIYEGVDAYGGAPQKFRGETGAQSSIVPAVDALLGVRHADDPLRLHLAELRDYMPPGHRKFIETIETSEPVRPFIQRTMLIDAATRDAYNACLHWLELFRTVHVEFAANYIHRQAQADAGNPTFLGTGGTPFMPYLLKHRDETAAHRL
jgi:indoleamine 2,3-dioxygenase